ncbi:MAG TPA: hypothetical protein VFE54_04530 [Mucilaginibacter sp.]|jgi:hypothetical protein|nr:hypothetical protein [Mucilaginibacter sp.]
MAIHRKNAGCKARLKHLLMLPLFIGLLCICSHAFSQSPPPPPPPPPPDELFKKINPFKKHKKDTANKTADTAKNKMVMPAGGPPPPPPPPNPLNLFKRKKDTTKKG